MSKVSVIMKIDETDGQTVEATLLSGDLDRDRVYMLVPVDGSGPQVRHDATDTSRAAAERVAPHLRPQHLRILDFLTFGPHVKGFEHFVGGATDKDIAECTGLSENSVRPRRGELVKMGLVRDSGKRRSGSIVWEHVPEPDGGR